jgi:hypothetical protein
VDKVKALWDQTLHLFEQNPRPCLFILMAGFLLGIVVSVIIGKKRRG